LGFANFKKPPISWQSTKSCNKVATSIICILQNLYLFSSVICFQILFLSLTKNRIWKQINRRKQLPRKEE
jgi:hypothetical protein